MIKLLKKFDYSFRCGKSGGHMAHRTVEKVSRMTVLDFSEWVALHRVLIEYGFKSKLALGEANIDVINERIERSIVLEVDNASFGALAIFDIVDGRLTHYEFIMGLDGDEVNLDLLFKLVNGCHIVRRRRLNKVLCGIARYYGLSAQLEKMKKIRKAA